MSEYIVFTQKCMSYLTSRGFVLLRMQKDIKNIKFNVFIFRDSENLRVAVKEYKDRLNNING